MNGLSSLSNNEWIEIKKEVTIRSDLQELLITADLLDMWEKMLKESTTALKEYPNHPLLLNYRVKALFNTHQDEKAFKEVEENYQNHPNHTPTLLTAMKIAEKRENYKRVHEIASRLAKSLPLNRDVKRALEESNKKLFSKKNHHKNPLPEKKNHLTTLLLRTTQARISLNNEEIQKAYDEADDILKHNPKFKAALSVKAEAALRLKRTQEAHDLSLKIVKEYPDDVSRCIYARALFLKEDFDHAKQQAELTLKHYSSNTHAKCTLALAELYKGNAEKAYHLAKEISVPLIDNNFNLNDVYAKLIQAEAAQSLDKFKEVYELSLELEKISQEKLSVIHLKVSAAAFIKEASTVNALLKSATKEYPDDVFLLATQSLFNQPDYPLDPLKVKSCTSIRSHSFPGVVLAIRNHLKEKLYEEASLLCQMALKQNPTHPVFLRFSMRIALKRDLFKDCLTFGNKLLQQFPSDQEAAASILLAEKKI